MLDLLEMIAVAPNRRTVPAVLTPTAGGQD